MSRTGRAPGLGSLVFRDAMSENSVPSIAMYSIDFYAVPDLDYLSCFNTLSKMQHAVAKLSGIKSNALRAKVQPTIHG
jgi:hypothetical protein